MALRLDPNAQRTMLELSFEPDGDGYVFFKNVWSSGVPVTAVERETYLSAGLLSGRGEFYRTIADRQATRPPRPANAVRLKIFRAFPLFVVLTSALVGLGLIRIANAETSTALRLAFYAVALPSCFLAVMALIAKLLPQARVRER